MTPELENLCKQLHIAGVYQFIQDQYGSDPDTISILIGVTQNTPQKNYSAYFGF